MVASSDGFVNAWVDFDQDGTFTPGEKVLDGQVVIAGTNSFSIPIPADATETTDSPSFARFRYSTTNRFLPPTALAGLADFQRPDGEVEDYAIRIESAADVDLPEFDFGSLLGTIDNDDFLAVRPDISIGAAVAGEPGPTSSPTADEVDGVMLGDEEWRWLLRGAGTLTVMADWDGDGQFGEHEDIGGCTLLGGSKFELQECTLSVADIDTNIGSMPQIPPGSVVTVRSEFKSPDMNPDGIAYGEIVDLPWLVPEPEVEGQAYFDFGDAPNSYGTRLNNNGARHRITDGVRLGHRIDREADGQPSSGAWRDDATNRDDEDGVFFTSAIAPGQVATIDVGVSRGNGLLDAWMDFNQDGTFAANERIFASVAVTPGLNSLSFNVPNVNWNPLLPLYSRFRVSTAGGLSPVGPAEDGEVEDYAILQGDLNNDGQIDIDDADILQSAIQGDNEFLTATLDLNGDGELNRKEMQYFRENILLTVEGDLDGDGDADFEDFLKFSANYGKKNVKYSEGDLDGDGESDFSDFLGFSASFGGTIDRSDWIPVLGANQPDSVISVWPRPTELHFDKIEW